MTPKRIFVLGLQRSGTTWLANMLAALPEVAAIHNERHRGVHESVFFSHFAKAFGPWDDPIARSEFLDAFAASDYYLLSDMDDELLWELEQSSQGYGDFFVTFMDLLAISTAADAWVEKSPHHTLLTKDIQNAAPDARFIIVERRADDLILSRLHGFGRKPKKGMKLSLDILRGVLSIALYQKETRRLAKSENALLVRYDDLKNDKNHKVKRRILDHIGIQADPSKMISAYSANTSFSNGERYEFSKRDRIVFKIAEMIGAVLPLRLLMGLHHKREARRGVEWPEWVWTIKERPKGGANTVTQTDEL